MDVDESPLGKFGFHVDLLGGGAEVGLGRGVSWFAAWGFTDDLSALLGNLEIHGALIPTCTRRYYVCTITWKTSQAQLLCPSFLFLLLM